MESSGHMTDLLLVMSKVRVGSGQFIFHFSFPLVLLEKRALSHFKAVVIVEI